MSVVLDKQLDFAEDESLSFYLLASDGMLNTTVPVTVAIEDVQNTPPVFIGSLTGIVQEDAPIVSQLDIFPLIQVIYTLLRFFSPSLSFQL